MRGEGGCCGFSGNEYSCAHGAQINLWRSYSILNLCPCDKLIILLADFLHGLSSLYLELELLGGDVVDLAGGVLVYHGELGAAGGQVQASDGGADLQQVHGEGIVDENLEDLAIF